jgi:hypothetical protein
VAEVFLSTKTAEQLQREVQLPLQLLKKIHFNIEVKFSSVHMNTTCSTRSNAYLICTDLSLGVMQRQKPHNLTYSRGKIPLVFY